MDLTNFSTIAGIFGGGAFFIELLKRILPAKKSALEKQASMMTVVKDLTAQLDHLTSEISEYQQQLIAANAKAVQAMLAEAMIQGKLENSETHLALTEKKLEEAQMEISRLKSQKPDHEKQS